jgi:hypothetical protein
MKLFANISMRQNQLSLQLGLDLKDDLSRFQVITKVPYPSLGDRWINEKRRRNEQWYKWQTALKLVQGYGRSVRSLLDAILILIHIIGKESPYY